MTIHELVYKKRILIVGNGKEILGKSEYIDSYPFVIRFNNALAYIRDGHNVGRKTDAWVCAQNKTTVVQKNLDVARINNYSPKHIIRYCGKDTMPQTNIPMSYIGSGTKQEVQRMLDVEVPSTGIVLLHYLTSYCNAESIMIIGFDHFKTPNFYYQQNVSDPQHDQEKEARYVQRLVNEGKIIRFTNDQK